MGMIFCKPHLTFLKAFYGKTRTAPNSCSNALVVEFSMRFAAQPLLFIWLHLRLQPGRNETVEVSPLR
jgi:hypothetical protein